MRTLCILILHAPFWKKLAASILQPCEQESNEKRRQTLRRRCNEYGCEYCVKRSLKLRLSFYLTCFGTVASFAGLTLSNVLRKQILVARFAAINISIPSDQHYFMCAQRVHTFEDRPFSWHWNTNDFVAHIQVIASRVSCCYLRAFYLSVQMKLLRF